MTPVSFYSFRNNGTSFGGRLLGALDLTTGYFNGVELKFKVTDGTVYQRDRGLTAVQWAGPEAIWVKFGTSAAWLRYSTTQGTGADGPDNANVNVDTQAIAYYDNPGIPIFLWNTLKEKGAQRIHAIQNFTGWVVGYPLGGGGAEQLSETSAWNSIVSIVKTDGGWVRDASLSGAGMGWTDIRQPPTP